MNNIMIGIISYLPSADKIRNERLSCAIKQADGLIDKLIPRKDVFAVLQCYTDSEANALGYGGTRHDKGITASGARNEILKAFYASDKDYLLVMDDDLLIYDYYEVFKIFKDLDENTEKFMHLDAFSGVHAAYNPFKFRNKKEEVTTHWTFNRLPPNEMLNFQFIKNIKKHAGKEIWYRPQDNSDGIVFTEDGIFSLDWIKAGFNFYQCNQMILNHLGKDTSVIWDDSIRGKQEQQASRKAAALLGIGLRPDGRINWKPFMQRYNTTLRDYAVMRAEPIKNHNDKWYEIKKKKKDAGPRRSLLDN